MILKKKKKKERKKKKKILAVGGIVSEHDQHFSFPEVLQTQKYEHMYSI